MFLHVVDDERRLEAAEGQREPALHAVHDQDGAFARSETSLFVLTLRRQDVGDREGRTEAGLRAGRHDGGRHGKSQHKTGDRRSMEGC